MNKSIRVRTRPPPPQGAHASACCLLTRSLRAMARNGAQGRANLNEAYLPSHLNGRILCSLNSAATAYLYGVDNSLGRARTGRAMRNR